MEDFVVEDSEPGRGCCGPASPVTASPGGYSQLGCRLPLYGGTDQRAVPHLGLNLKEQVSKEAGGWRLGTGVDRWGDEGTRWAQGPVGRESIYS